MIDRRGHICMVGCVLVTSLLACEPAPDKEPTECYPIDPNGNWPLDPIDFVSNYCGWGGEPFAEPLEARFVIWCVDEPATGCEPCVVDADAADAGLLGEVLKIYEAQGCPANYEPEELIRGCYSPMPEFDRCCYTAEYVTDTRICTLPQGTVP